MRDAYTHLDMSSADPIADLRGRLASAGLSGALVVETWDGANRTQLDRLRNDNDSRLNPIYCFRGTDLPLDIRAVRAKTTHLSESMEWLAAMQDSGKWLLVHAESGIGALTPLVIRAAALYPGLRIYVPHLAWPRRDGVDDPAWKGAIEALSQIPSVSIGVSAIAYFSRTPFPHEDVHALAAEAIALFGASRVLAGSDYPLFEKSAYAAYIDLARRWVLDVWPEWPVPNLGSNLFLHAI
jgi:hypothetical protein